MVFKKIENSSSGKGKGPKYLKDFISESTFGGQPGNGCITSQ